MKYRKKPVVVEAVQFIIINFDEIEEFVGGYCGKNAKGEGVIATHEGAMKIAANDWIIKSVDGKFHTVKPDIFEKTYEEVKDEN